MQLVIGQLAIQATQVLFFDLGHNYSVKHRQLYKAMFFVHN